MSGRLIPALVVSLVPLLFVPIAAADDLCGATIVADLKLDHDLTCPADGLIVAADGIELDLNGFSITGGGGGVGIAVFGRTNVWISRGTIRNFGVAIRINGSSGVVIRENQFSANAEGIDMQAGSTRNTIRDNAFASHTTRGIMLRGNVTRNVLKGNTFTGDRVGVLVFAGVDNYFQGNLVSGSTLAGIRVNVFATGNVMVANTVTSNVAGIDFIATAAGAPVGNTFLNNRITMNGCGLKGPADGNRFAENLFEGNGADRCP